MAIRFRTRFVHATVTARVRTQLEELGWTGTGAINFSADPVKVIDYAPEDRAEVIKANTVAVSLGDLGDEVDEELGASAGGTRSLLYPIFLDIYMPEGALAMALGDDLREAFDVDTSFDLTNQITKSPEPGALLQVEYVRGPERPDAAMGTEPYKRNWRIVRLGVRLYYQT